MAAGYSFAQFGPTTIKSLRKYLWNHLSSNTQKVLERVKANVRGWVNYHAVTDNHAQVYKFISLSRKTLFKWFNRRGGKRRMNWQRLIALLDRIDYPNVPKAIKMFSLPMKA